MSAPPPIATGWVLAANEAMGHVWTGRSTAAQAMLTAIVNEAKSVGIARKAIEQYQLKGVRAAQD
jgi:hypothetical protein